MSDSADQPASRGGEGDGPVPGHHTAHSTFGRVAEDLAHRAFPHMAAALRARLQPILDHWRKLSMEAMPHLQGMTQAEFEDTIADILSAAADALESADPGKLRGVIEHGPGHGIDRFLQRFNLLDLFEEVRILRGVVIVEMADEMGRMLTVEEAATFHAIFDIIIQQGVMMLVQKQQHEFQSWQDALRERNEALERSNADLLQFASAASHDLKEPLRGISTLARFIGDDDPDLSDLSRQRLVRIGALCERLGRMVAGLIEHARSGVMPRLEECNLDEVIHRIIDTSREHYSAMRARVEVKEGRLPTIRADCALMERVLANLIANGIKFNDSPEKRVEIFWDDRRSAIALHDNGIGIEPRHHDKLFTIFKRLHDAGRYPGEGLGLAIARRIIEAHGGHIEIESAGISGQGTTFYIVLPAALLAPQAGE